MHLLVDGQALQTPSSRMRGIGRYSSCLLRALRPSRPHWRIEVVQNAALPPIAADDLGGLPVVSFQPPIPAGVGQQEINERYYADWLTARRPDGILILSHCEGWEALVPCFCGERPPVFGIAYDLIPLLYPEYYLREVGVSHWYAHRFRHLLYSDVLLAISEATARDVRTLGAEQAPQVVNIAGAVDPLFAPLSLDELAARAPRLREKFGLHREFLLYVGAADYRKNLRGAIRAFGALPPDCRAPYDLAVVCRVSAKEQAAIRETARQAGVADSLKLICSAGDEELRALYALCRLFFFPSLYEGLGLPVLEALHCGAPVVTSENSSLPEYAGPVSWLGDASSPEAMAAVLREALAEPRELRRAEREAFARTFSWPRTAERACAAMERGTKRRVARRRRRLAWVTPLTPETPRAAEYAAGLLPHLADRFDVELVVGHGPMAVPEVLSRNHLILSAQETAARHAALPYDMFVYQLGSSGHHLFMLELLHEFPGLVVLHDFAAADVERLAEINLLRPRAKRNKDDDPRAHAPGLGLLVHSARAWQQARRAVDTPTVHLPPPLSPPPLQDAAAERSDLGLPAGVFLVCVLVEDRTVHRLPDVLGATASLPAALREQLHVVVVGEGEGAEGEATCAAAELGLSERVLWRRVTRNDLARYARAADVCVQPRDPLDGEVTPLLLALASGTACVVSGVGPAAELPDEVIWKTRTPPHEREDLAAALRALAADPVARRARGEAGVRHVAEHHDPRRLAEAYARWIDLAIARHQEADGLWRGFVVRCLTGHPDEADAVIDSWAALRALGQRQLAAPPGRAPAATVRPAA